MRTPSGHDIPIPESVFLALANIQDAVKEQGDQARTWQANHDSTHKDLGETVAQLVAGKRHDWAKIISLVAGAIATIVGAVRVTAPTPPAPVNVISRDALSVDLEACSTLPESNRIICQQGAAERDRLRKGGVPGR